jgi:alpha,alpha-trehalase
MKTTLQIHQLGKLFEEVQLKSILGDGKTFPDCIPKKSLEKIQEDFVRQYGSSSFDLRGFIKKNFTLPSAYSANYKSDTGLPPGKHIEILWNVLTRKPGDIGRGSLIPLPFQYVVPGGRFREIYYWDSYFTMLGLRVSNRVDLIQSMVDNFAYLIDTLGYIPNGNRTYFLGRSQPPFFSLMVTLLHEIFIEKKGDGSADPYVKYLPQLEKEYSFWMNGQESLSGSHPSELRVVRMDDGAILNRYWDLNDTPRPEAFKEDIELSQMSAQAKPDLFRHLRAAAESGWDFSSRWFRNGSFESIHTTDIIPVDLNCLLLHLEQTLAEAHKLSGDIKSSENFVRLSFNRAKSIQHFCWSDEKQFFFDYDFVSKKTKSAFTLAAAFPLFFRVADKSQALAVSKVLNEKFLKAGGLVTTLEFSGQQWDAPNGWAPLQWIAYKGLTNYELNSVADDAKARWLNSNLKVYQKTGKMTEKYDVCSENAEASGGEYPNQDGFGWTNGVFLAMAGR